MKILNSRTAHIIFKESQQIYTCSKSILETLEKSVKYLQS